MLWILVVCAVVIAGSVAYLAFCVHGATNDPEMKRWLRERYSDEDDLHQ